MTIFLLCNWQGGGKSPGIQRAAGQIVFLQRCGVRLDQGPVELVGWMGQSFTDKGAVSSHEGQ